MKKNQIHYFVQEKIKRKKRKELNLVVVLMKMAIHSIQQHQLMVNIFVIIIFHYKIYFNINFNIIDYDSEEVLTYERVVLYYPHASHKRPVVLIGPPNIGRHELRQRLMQDSERFAAAIPRKLK